VAPRYRGQGRDGQVAPILMLRMRRDAPCERPCALCERGCELAPPVAVLRRGGAC
jgi:hypothetical protein